MKINVSTHIHLTQAMGVKWIFFKIKHFKRILFYIYTIICYENKKF